jgi:hypothetical protein
MKIFNFGLSIDTGKHKYIDECFKRLVDKFSPDKSSPYIVEVIDTDIEKSDAIVVSNDKKLDFVLIDLDKIEKRILRTEDEKERNILKKCQKVLEEEIFLCDGDFSEEEKNTFKLLQLVTSKPSVVKDSVEDLNSLIQEVIDKSGIMFFFTCGKKEVRAWKLDKGSTAHEAAGCIHSDLKRGFIKAEITNCRDLDNFFNMAEAKSRGFTKVVDKDYTMQPNDIIDVRFNV